jgi:hypothetical protein
MIIAINVQTIGSIVGIFCVNSVKASVFLGPWSVLPHFVVTELMKDVTRLHPILDQFRDVSFAPYAARIQIAAIYSSERCSHISKCIGKDYRTNYLLLFQWYRQQFNMQGNVSRSGVTETFIRNLLKLSHGDYLPNGINQPIVPQLLQVFAVRKTSFTENLRALLFQTFFYRLLMIAIFYLRWEKLL